MAKGPKLQFSLLKSIQFCRPKDPSSLVKNPIPNFTHINSKSFYISFPSFPDPPPSPPDHPSSNVDSSKITPLDNEFSPHEYYYSKTRKACEEITTNSNFQSDFNEISRIQKKKEKTTSKKPKAKCSESQNLLSSPPSCSSSHGLRTIAEEEPSKKPVKQRSVRTQRFKRYGSKDWKDGCIMTAPENKSQEQKPVHGKLEDKRENKSFVVVKRSEDPYEDFKKSMLEMIVDKQMSEPKELEQLLMSFLSLNSRLHHKVILKAFTDIWKEVFSGSLNKCWN